MREDDSSGLNANNLDRAVSVTRGVLGAIPVVGPIISEVVGNIIPSQRIDRITRFVEILDKKLDATSKEILRLKVQDEYFVDLLEDGFILASRSITEERKEQVATIIKNSLSNQELSHIEEKRLLYILSELSEAEIIILQFHALIGEEQRAFLEKHKDIIQAPIVHMGSTQEQINKEAIYRTFKQNLVSLNLLTPRYAKPKRGEFPEFDEKTGMMKANGYNVTTLGRLLLSYLDLKPGL